MDVWVGRCNKTANCNYCKQPITVGEPEVFGKLWRMSAKEGGEPRRWVITFHWHARRKIDEECCWLVQALDKFDITPHVETRGRKKIRLSKPKRLQRLSILRRRARVLQRLRAEMDGEERNVDNIIHLGNLLEKLKEEILPLGGMPKSWE